MREVQSLPNSECERDTFFTSQVNLVNCSTFLKNCKYSVRQISVKSGLQKTCRDG